MAKILFSELAMAKYIRTPGGEKNKNSGKRWTKEELSDVLDSYLNELRDGQGIHEHNPVVHMLSLRLERTVRSVEAQLLMFRNLDRFGDYSWGNMNKLCIELWKEYLIKQRGES